MTILNMTEGPSATALIADDDEAPRALLAAALAQLWPQLKVVTEVSNGTDAWDAWLEHEPQIAFLDVRMPGLTGIEVAQRIRAKAQVVFVATPGDHALAAFDEGAVDYIVKPVDAARLQPVVAQLQTRLEISGAAAGAWQPLLDRLAGQVRKPAPLDVIGPVQAGVPMSEVAWLEADGRQTRVVHGAGELHVRTPLKELLAQLDPAMFWQVSRHLVVNQSLIADALRADDGSMTLTLRGRAERLPVARHFQRLFQGR
jgi:DNA-binding LytR/AlgR family response regulator